MIRHGGEYVNATQGVADGVRGLESPLWDPLEFAGKGEIVDVPSTQLRPPPGKITFRDEWNHSARVEDAASVPDSIKFILYDAKGLETSDAAQATRRVPILEISTRSVDAHGKPVEPRLASIIEITSYGPEHHFLRHTTARVPFSGPK